MKKNMIVIIILLISFSFINVNAFSFTKDENGNIKTIPINGYNPVLNYGTWDNDGNLIFLGYYKEVNSQYADDGYVIPGVNMDGSLSGTGTTVRNHAKIIKFDSSYNKIWEKDFYQTGNWANSDAKADTIQTQLKDITQLADGTYLAVGQTHGLSRQSLAKDDDFDSIIVRLDKDGNEIYRYLYHDKGLDNAISVSALKDGGYVVKFYFAPTLLSGLTGRKEPSEFKVTDYDSKYYYVVYDANNSIVNAYSESQKSSLDSLNYIDGAELEAIKTITTESFLDTSLSNSPSSYFSYNPIYFILQKNYHGLSIDLVNSSNKYINIIGISNGEVDVEVDFDNYQRMINEGTFNNISNSDSNGNGVIIVKSDTEEDFAKYIVNGKEVNYNLGTFVENNRTYISLSNLCPLLNCEYKYSENDSNKLIIDFDIFNAANKMVSIEESENLKINANVKYTVVHDVGSKKYTSYLSFQPNKIFRLNSPYYDADAVDVASKVIDGQVYVPLRFISEALGRYVKYEPGVDGGKPVITIGAYGEGDFYEKYSVKLSYDNLQENSPLTNEINNNKLELAWGLEKLVYAYGYNNLENHVVSVDKTVFVPTMHHLVSSAPDLEYKDIDDSRLTNHYTYLNFESKDNWIGKSVRYKDDNGQNGDKNYGIMYEKGLYTTFIAVSNIEGYPFMKIVNFI